MPSRPAIAFFLACIACSASAQEQTVESAMDFLAEVLAGQQFNPNWTVYKGKPLIMDDHWGTLETVGPSKRCVLSYKGKMPAIERAEGRWKAFEPKDEWDFGKVFEIRKVGTSDIEMVHHGEPAHISFRLNSALLRARVAYAMDYLRVNCDAMRRTGF